MNPFAEWGIRFAHPWLLLLLLAIPVLSYIRGGRGGAAAVTFSSLKPLRALGKHCESKAGNFLAGITLLGVALLILALARPQKGKTITHVESSGIDIMICIDVSGSMLSEDYMIGNQRASRIDTIKQVTEQFIEGRPADRIGLIAFGGRPYLVSPLTLDHDWLLKNIAERVKVGLVEDSTAIGSAIVSACNRLKDKDSKSRIIVLLTDGDNNAGKVSPATAAEAAKAIGVKLYAIGAGSNGYAPYPVGKDVFGNVQYQNMDFPFDENGLKRIADIAGGHFYRAGDTDSLKHVFADIDKLEKSKVELTTYRQVNDLFPWFIGAGLALLTTEFALSQSLWRKTP